MAEREVVESVVRHSKIDESLSVMIDSPSGEISGWEYWVLDPSFR